MDENTKEQSNDREREQLPLIPGIGKPRWRLPDLDFAWILVMGAMGGGLSFLWPGDTDHSVLSHAALGGGAAVIFVYIVANSDRRNLGRLLAISLLAGFGWSAVWETALRQTALADVDKSDPDLQSEATEQALSTFQETQQVVLASQAEADQPDSEEQAITQRTIQISDAGASVSVQDTIYSATYWIGITIDNPVTLSIAVIADTDLTATFSRFDDGLLSFVSYSDDSELSYNPLIETGIDPGEYLLAIAPFGNQGIVGALEITVEARDPNSP